MLKMKNLAPLFLLFALDENIKNEILKNRSSFAELMKMPASMIVEDELTHCHGRLSSNRGSNLIGSCYFSDNGSIYILAVTEKVTKNYEIQYPVYQMLNLTSEL